jgi:hypothetical protein
VAKERMWKTPWEIKVKSWMVDAHYGSYVYDNRDLTAVKVVE